MKHILWVLLFCLACRQPEQAPTRLFEEGFEEVCDGMPCGWAQTGGDDGAVRFVETIFAGEHGVRLTGDGAAVRGPGGPARTATLTFGTVEARISGVCDVGALLVVEAALVDTDRSLSDTFTGFVSLPEDYTEGVRYVQLTGATALLDGGITGGMFGGVVNVQVSAVAFRVQGSGQCTVDHIVIDDTGFTDTPRPSSC